MRAIRGVEHPMPVSRTDAILAAVKRQLEERRTLLDRGADIGAVTVTVKLHVGTAEVKSVVCSDERINRRLSDRT